jgi:hypothetical protein
MQDSFDTVLDSFQEPLRGQKRKVRSEAVDEQRKKRRAAQGKCTAAECFNEAPSEEDLKLWSRFVKQPLATQAELERILHSAEVSHIQYDQLAKTKGIFCVFNFIAAASHCEDWLQAQLLQMGWECNMTGYHPISVSQTTDELLDNFLECYKMAAKQMLWVINVATSSSKASGTEQL